ncbi:unnamed protein product [Cuscuta campestris]|uniref:F-box domain-containing protein n=1 Tax=Cuscuta campestris TaxID=132261 RepID=A0A484KST1_9ASTE|nr:unnamed protein product [Cuscuta campestris]
MENQRDRLSNLPDSLIHTILSLLDTKSAVRTFLLSKKWTHHWKSSLHTLRLSSPSFRTKNSFKRFVEFVLANRDPSAPLRALILFNESRDKSLADRILRYAVAHSVREIDVFRHLEPNELEQILGCKSLRRIVFHSIEIGCSDFSGCADLGDLSLTGCTFFPGRVTVGNMKNLTIIHTHFPYHEYGDNDFKIFSQSLSTLTFGGKCSSFAMIRLRSPCPVVLLDKIDLRLIQICSEESDFPVAVKTLRWMIFHSKSLVLEMKEKKKEFRVKTELVGDKEVRLAVFNVTTAETEFFWKAADENFEPFLSTFTQV